MCALPSRGDDMERCCFFCKWCRDGVCEHDEMATKLNIYEEFIYPLFENGDVHAVLDEYGIEGDERIKIAESIQSLFGGDETETVPFTPPDYREFSCSYYE